MSNALIGHTGFVGSNLLRTESFEDTYNSKNIPEIEGRVYDRVVCAGVSAVKWWANAHPDEDWAGIQSLMGHLEKMEAERFILISTVDVYGRPFGDENAVLDADGDLHAYGRHRLKLEAFVQERFSQSHVVRLPGLFGHGLKKNVIYDLLNGNQTTQINPDSSFQWYPIARLAADLAVIEARNIELVNLACEPVATHEITERWFPETPVGPRGQASVQYDVQTRYADVFGGEGRYMMQRPAVLAALDEYIKHEEAARGHKAGD